MQHQVFFPSQGLSSFIARYEFSSYETGPAGNGNFVFLPNFSNAFLFCYYQRGQIKLKNSTVGETSIPPISLIPPVNTPAYNDHVAYLSSVRIIFQPGALWALYGIPMYHFTNQVIDASEAFDIKLKELYEKIYFCGSNQTKVQLLDSYFASRLKSASKQRGLFRYLNHHLLSHNYECSVDGVANNLGLSSRHLQRLQRKHFGLSPKDFINIHRFNSVLNYFNTTPEVSLRDVAFRFSYFDPAHFSREFKRRSDMTPGQYLLNHPNLAKIMPSKEAGFLKGGYLIEC